MPTTQTGTEVLVAQSGTVYVAPVGTTAPANASASFSATWVNLGYLDENGLTYTTAPELQEIPAWQTPDPVRVSVIRQVTSLGMNLLQWNEATVPFAFGGGSVASDGGNLYHYDAPSTSTVDERAVAVEMVDGSRTFRIIVPRGMVGERGEVTINRNGASVLPVTFRALTPTSGALYTWQFDDAQFAA